MPACLSALARPGRLLPACSSRPVQAVSCPPAPHEVGVCHRLWPVSFPDFVCLFGFARLLVSAPSRLQACSCLLHMKSVFVTGYGLCHFLTSCVFPRPRPPPVCHFPTSCDFPRPWPRPCPRAPASCPPVSVRARGRGRAPAGTPPHQRTCSAGAGFPTPASPAIRTTSQHAGHAARNFGAFQCHLAQSHVVQGLDAVPPRVDVGLIEVTRGYRIGVEQRE